MFNIKLGDKTYEGVEKVKLNTTDGSTATFIGEGSEPLKAFVRSPFTASEVIAKNIAIIPSEFQYVNAYIHTNTTTERTISVEFDYGEVGDTLVLAYVIRTPSTEPTVPSGWTKVAWIGPHEKNTSNQWLFIATMTTDESTAGTAGTVSFDVGYGNRHYLMVTNIEDSVINTANPIISKVGDARIVNTELFENTLLICSSETTGFYDGTSWVELNNSGYIVGYRPSYGDDSLYGGRLAMLYVPFKSQQPFSELSLEYYSNSEGPATSIALCALNVTPGKRSLLSASII